MPVFSCIFCSNDTIAFKHLLQENITNKYLFQTSIYDIRDINKLFMLNAFKERDLNKKKELLESIFDEKYLSPKNNFLRLILDFLLE